MKEHIEQPTDWLMAVQDRDTLTWHFAGKRTRTHDQLRDMYCNAFTPGSEYIAEHQNERTDWLVQGFLPAGYLAVLAGTSKSGKSCLLTALGIAVASGKPFAGMPTAPHAPLCSQPSAVRGPAADAQVLQSDNRQSSNQQVNIPTEPRMADFPLLPSGGRGKEGAGRHGWPTWGRRECRQNGESENACENEATSHGSAVLWCAYEESPAERAEILGAFPHVPNNFYITHERPLIDTPQGIDALRFWIDETGARLIVIDPLYAAVQDTALSHGPTARNALDGLKRLCAEKRVTAVLIHHLTKAPGPLDRGRIAESNQLLAAASMDIVMDSADAVGGRLITLRCKGRGDFANRTLVLHSKGVAHYIASSYEGTATVRRMRETAILDTLKNGRQLTSAQIAEETGLTLQCTRDHMVRLLRSNRVTAVDKNRHATIYRLPTTPLET